ncbi:apolipoprotein N-acyltransferase, partial [Campylobacter coli]|nr:apolipoprotein N-acyltransferase [Campylobacter coli]
MKLKLNFLPYFSFIPKKLNTNSIIFKIIKVFFIAFLLSNCIYLSFFENIFTQAISSFLAIWGLVLLLKSKSPKQYFWIGFFVGILWFWWIGLSSIYFDLNYLVPIVIILIGIVYGILFRICYLFKFDFLRLCGIFCLSFIHPLGFDWLNWGVYTVYGFFDPSYRGIICIFLL